MRRPGLRGGKARMLACGDVVALVGAYAFSYLVSDAIAPLPPVSAPAWLLSAVAVIAIPVWVATFMAYRLYDNDSLKMSIASFDEVGDVFHALLTGSLGFLILSQALRVVGGWWLYMPVEAALFCGAALVLVPLVRGSIRSWVFPRVMQRRRTLIVGTGAEARLVERKLRAHPEYGLEVVGFLAGDDDEDDEVPGRVLGSKDEIGRIIVKYDVQRVVLAGSVASHEEMLDLIRELRNPELFISIVPRYSEIFTSHATLDDVEGMPVVTLPPTRLSRSSRFLKRAFDFTVSSLALTLLAPLLAVVAVAIRLDSPGPAIYRQPRRGRNGSTFEIAKFRTMYIGAEQRRADVLELNEVDGPLFKIKQGRDPRVTRIGNFLRKTSIDELPQLWNVLRGQMSLVGPRPFVVYEADLITGWAEKRLDMTPGITGVWQVLGRNDIPFDEMCKLDYLYVTNWSLWWDLKILAQTIPVVLMRRGAY
jgi:exopolysaccharide biosynthesis polyprenyl glycosylphosphotransferase